MSFSIYDLDEDIRKILNVENFLEGMSVRDFVEELSKDHFLKGAGMAQLDYLDPKPYIRTFESTMRELKRLGEQSGDHQRRAEREVQDRDRKHSENVLHLSEQVERVTTLFDALDKKISNVSENIAPVGLSLNNLANSRDRSQETIFLIRAYHGFYTKENYEPLEKLRVSTVFEDRLKCAKTLRSLINLAKKIESAEVPKSLACTAALEKFGETMERTYLANFEEAYELNKFDAMREIVSILFQYNGGNYVVRAFVSKNDLLLEAEKEEGEEENSLLDNEVAWINLADPNYRELIHDESTELLLDRLRVAIKGQARIVEQVFEDPIPVLKIYIQRIYAQMIQNKVGSLLQYSLSVNSLAHIRVLNYLYGLVNEFTKDVKEFLIANEIDKDNELSNILDQSSFDIFIEYISESTYFDREKKNLVDTIYYIAERFTNYNEKAVINKPLSSKIEQLENIEFGDRSGEQGEKTSFQLLQKKRLQKFTTFMKSHLSDMKRGYTEADKVNDKEYEEYSRLNISKVETVLRSAIESIARLLELTPTRTPENALEILEILIFDFGRLYVGAALDVIYDKLKEGSVSWSSSSISELDFSFLEQLDSITEVAYMVSGCIKRFILPCAVNSPPIKNRMTNLTNSFISRCELSLDMILNETIMSISTRLNFFLSKQKKRDFMRETITEEDTEACELCSDFLQLTYNQLSSYLSNANLTGTLYKIGMNFLNQLLEHYKKFTVNSTGGIVLTKDVIRFQTTIDKWHITELTDHFQLLKEISNLFTVHPNLLNSLVSEGQLANLKPYTTRQYIMKRSDFSPSYIERFFNLKH